LANSAHWSHRSAIRVHVALLAGSRANLAICRQSVACRRNSSGGCIGVDIDAKGVRKLLCDAGTTNTGIAAFELDYRVDEFLRWSVPAQNSGAQTTAPV